LPGDGFTYRPATPPVVRQRRRTDRLPGKAPPVPPRGRQRFLPLYLPDPLRWPVDIVMILLGIYLLYEAIQLAIKSSRPTDVRPSDRSQVSTDEELESV
jgi:hypothetical protein